MLKDDDSNIITFYNAFLLDQFLKATVKNECAREFDFENCVGVVSGGTSILEVPLNLVRHLKSFTMPPVQYIFRPPYLEDYLKRAIL